MIVKDEVRLNDYPNYRLEFGIATWTEKLPEAEQEESVRNRYDMEDGHFSPHNSSEIPLNDIEFIICECLKRDKLSTSSLINILKEIPPSIERQLKTGTAKVL